MTWTPWLGHLWPGQTCNVHAHTHTLSQHRLCQHPVSILFQAQYLPRHCYSAAMPPKGSQVQPHLLGNVLQETNDGITSWRLRAKPNCRHEYGPRRTTKAAAEADLVAARQATTHEQYASIVRDLCARARGGAHPSRKKAQNSSPRAGRGSGRIGETLSKPAHTHEEVKRRRMETPSASDSGAGQSTVSSASVIASLLQAATGPPNSQPAGHNGNVDNHGHDDVDSHDDNDHAEHDSRECDHDKLDGHVHHALVCIPSISAKTATKLRRSCADENGCGRCFCETCYPL